MKINNGHTLIIIFISCSIQLYAQQKKWDLETCIDYALEHNISIQKGENTRLSNAQNILASKGNFLPRVNMNLGQSMSLGQSELFPGNFANRTFHATNLGVSVSEVVFNGFKNTYLYKQSKLNLETANFELDKLKNDVALNVVNAYLNVVLNKEKQAIAETQLTFSKTQLNRVRTLVEAGVEPRASIYDAEASLSKDAQSLTLADNNVKLSRLSLAQLLQVPFQNFDVKPITVDTPSEALLYKNIQPILDYAMTHRAEIKAAQQRIASAKLSTKISKSGYYPSVSASYGLNTGANFSNLRSSNPFFDQLNENKGHTFRVGINIPIFSQFQNKTAVSKAKIAEANAALDLTQEKLTLESNIQRAYTDAQGAFRAYDAALKTTDSQRIAFDNAQKRYASGVISIFDLEQLRVAFLNAQATLINAKYEFVFKTKVLDFYMGKL